MAAGLSLGSIISKVIKSWLSSAGNITCGKGPSPTRLCAQPLILPEARGGPMAIQKSVLVRSQNTSQKVFLLVGKRLNFRKKSQ